MSELDQLSIAGAVETERAILMKLSKNPEIQYHNLLHSKDWRVPDKINLFFKVLSF